MARKLSLIYLLSFLDSTVLLFIPRSITTDLSYIERGFFFFIVAILGDIPLASIGPDSKRDMELCCCINHESPVSFFIVYLLLVT